MGRLLDCPEPMSAEDDFRFLVKLVHHGHLERGEAEPLLGRLKEGEGLEDLLLGLPGWDAERVARMIRTDAGERPEVAGHEVLACLGVGGTALKTRERKTGRQVALKILEATYASNPTEVRAFVEEARLLQRLEHPGLVKGFGPAKSQDQLMSRMEVVEGRTLLEYLDEGHLFQEDAAFKVVLEVAEVLAYMAGEGLVHRDIKPGNIMLTDSGRVKLIDLGFCAKQDAKDREGSARGTVQYLSPEQAEGGASADLRSDIYSLGVTLYQLTIGKLPFEGDEDEDVLRQHVMEKLSSPELKGRGHSPYLQYFIEKMMSKDADLRYQDWGELLTDVEEQVRGAESLDYKASAKDGRGRRRVKSTGRSKRRR